MNVVVEELAPCRRKLSITVPSETIDSEYNTALEGFKANADVPGFRKGRAPAAMVKAKFTKQILEHLRDNLLPKSYNEAVSENDLDVVQIIEVDEDIEVKVGEDLSFDVTVDVKPDFDLPSYKGIAVTREVAEVTEENIDEAVKGLLERQASFEDVTDRAAEAGDLVQIDFEGTLDGTPLKEVDESAAGVGGGEDFWTQADDNAFIPEIGAALPGLSIGDETEVSAEFAADFGVESLQGKTVDYKLSVKAMRGRVLPEMDDAFFEKVGAESEEDFRSKIKESIEAENKNASDGKMRQEIEAFLMENTKVDLPESVVAQEASRQVQQIIQNASQQGMTEEMFAENREEILQQANTGAESSTRLRYILGRIAKEESITVGEKDMKQEMAMMAYSYGMQPDELEKRIRESNSIEDFRTDIVVRRTMEFLLENANISE